MFEPHKTARRTIVPGLTFELRSFIRVGLLLAAQIYFVPQKYSWIVVIWLLIWVGSTFYFKRNAEKVTESFGLTLIGMIASLFLMLMPIGLIAVGLLGR